MTLFYHSLITSAVLLVAALLCVRLNKSPGYGITTQIAIATFLFAFIGRGSLAIFVQGSFVVILTMNFYWWKWSFRSFVLAVICSSVLSYAIISVVMLREIEGYRELRERMTMELVSERVPTVKQPANKFPLSKDTIARVELFETKLKDEGMTAEEFLRYAALRTLHSQKMESFVSSSGFGIRRIIARPTEERVAQTPPPPIPQPAPLSESERAFSLVGQKPADELRPGLSAFHLGSMLSFVNARGFGILTEDKRLFGFQPHHFQNLPDTDDWQVRSLELVGLLIGDEPRVYETKELPRMDKIRDIPTRPLDAFEAAGLETIKTGEDLYARSTPHGVRMLGAIRSVEQCVKCHGGERGDLLGAFSYSLQKKK